MSAPNAADSTTAPGAVIAGHRIVGTLERGKSGGVFRAEAPDGTPVVIRLERPSGGRAGSARVLARAELLKSLSHPAIARVTGFGEAPEGIWVATAEVEGPSLRRLIDRDIAPMRAVRLLGEVADGIDAAHRAGVAHGDIRAENVIVRGRPVESAVLTGFPLSTGDANPDGDIAALEAILRECVPHMRPAVDGSRPTAGHLVAAWAKELLYPVVSDPVAAEPEEGQQEQAAATPKRRRWRQALGGIGAIVLVAGAGAGGYAVSERAQDDAPPPAATASAGPLTVAVPPEWQSAGADRPLRELEEGVALTRRSPAGAISAGIAADRAAVLDPATLVRDIAGRAPRPRQVRLGQLRALRFDGLAGDGPSVVYVASTSVGAPAVACSGSDIAEACAQAADGLAVRGARAFDPAAGVRWKGRLAREMRSLRARRGRQLRALRGSDTPAGQAAAAARVAAIYAGATGRIRRAKTPPQARAARRRVLGALLEGDRAYRSLARATGADDEEAFDRARQRVRRADRRLQLTLRSL